MWPTVIFLTAFAVTSIICLIFGVILEPFFGMMPDGPVKVILTIVFPYGLGAVIFLGTTGAYLRHQQKSKYSQIREE